MTKRVFLLFSVFLFPAASLCAALRGVVLTVDGKPVARADVRMYEPETIEQRLERWRSGSERIATASTATDDSGAFAFTIDFTGMCDVAVTAGHLAPAARRASSGGRLTLVMLPAATIHGKITARGKPVAGARLVWRGVDSAERTATTDATGSYESTDPGPWAASVVVIHPDFAPAFMVRPRGESRRISAFRMPFDFELDPGRAIQGVVRDADGAAIAGAPIAIDGFPCTRSSHEGTFAIAHAPTMARFIETRTDSAAGRADAHNTAPLTVLVHPSAVLRGRVIDAADAPLAGVEIIVNASNGAEAPRSALSGADGTFVLPQLAPGQREVEALAPGYDIAPRQVRIDSAPAELTFRAIALGSISGRVRDGRGEPVAAARVTVSPATEAAATHTEMRTAFTAKDGSFTVADAPVLTLIRIGAIRRGYEPALSSPIELRPGETKSGVELSAARAITLAGRVIGDDRVGVAGATVTLRDRERLMPPELLPPPAKTDAAGKFSFEIPNGSYDVAVEHPSFAPREIAGFPAKNGPLEIALHRAVELRGVVMQGTAGAAGFAVAANKQKTLTNFDGSFTLGGLEPGDVLIVTRDENGFQRDKRTVRVPDFVTIRVAPGARVRGRVTDDSSKQPVRSFAITAQVSSNGPVRIARKSFTSEDGTFELPGLPAGRLRLSVDANGFAMKEIAERELDESAVVDGVEIALAKASILYGTISDESGAPIEGAAVALIPTGSRRRSDATSDSAGRYSITGLGAGAAEVNVQSETSMPESLSVQIAGGENKRDITLHRGGQLRGSVMTEERTPIGAATVTVQFGGLSRTATTDDSGAFDVPGLGAGPFSVIASKSGFALARREVARADEPLVVTLQRAGIISGRVTVPPDAVSPVFVTAGTAHGVASAQASADGTFRITGAPVGNVEVAAQVKTATGSRQTKPKIVAVAGEQEVWVELAFDPKP
jgi:hypothetical protein